MNDLVLSNFSVALQEQVIEVVQYLMAALPLALHGFSAIIAWQQLAPQ